MLELADMISLQRVCVALHNNKPYISAPWHWRRCGISSRLTTSVFPLIWQFFFLLPHSCDITEQELLYKSLCWAVLRYYDYTSFVSSQQGVKESRPHSNPPEPLRSAGVSLLLMHHDTQCTRKLGSLFLWDNSFDFTFSNLMFGWMCDLIYSGAPADALLIICQHSKQSMTY